ncbi:glycosyltransferase [Pontibacter vulgaris]|uniref:glycosyltransferase n=1 Tax=Pontibacter vulgaris TaxID=2905679 RepID=UPI001FA7A073|nr:glycosyltransferase [Pontibacter vulgaris]
MSKVKKFAFFVTALDAGGIENYLLRFLRFTGGEYQAYVICKGGRIGELKQQYAALENVNVIILPVGFYNILSWKTLYLFFKREQFDAVCDFTGNFAGLTLLIARVAAVKNRIVFYRGSQNHFKETTLRLIYNKLMNWLVIKSATKILSNSKSALHFFFPSLYNFEKHKFKVIYNGIDASSFILSVDKSIIREEIGIPKKAFVVGHTGRVNSAKNHSTILQVAEKVCNENNNIYFILCGKNTERLINKNVASDSILRHRVLLLGYRADINRVLKSFDIFFFPSITEGQPNSLIEALITGLPIIASNIEPIKETVPEELHRQLLDTNDVEGYSRQILEAYHLSSNSTIDNLSAWAINKYNPNKLFNEFLDELCRERK